MADFYDSVEEPNRSGDNDAEERKESVLQAPNDLGDRCLDCFPVRFPLNNISIIYSREVLAL